VSTAVILESLPGRGGGSDRGAAGSEEDVGVGGTRAGESVAGDGTGDGTGQNMAKNKGTHWEGRRHEDGTGDWEGRRREEGTGDGAGRSTAQNRDTRVTRRAGRRGNGHGSDGRSSSGQ